MSIQEQLGRSEKRRTIDLDLLDCESIIDEPDLQVPHPRMHERDFVLVPLKEIEPEYVHPITKKHIDEMIDGLEKQTILSQETL